MSGGPWPALRGDGDGSIVRRTVGRFFMSLIAIQGPACYPHYFEELVGATIEMTPTEPGLPSISARLTPTAHPDGYGGADSSTLIWRGPELASLYLVTSASDPFLECDATMDGVGVFNLEMFKNGELVEDTSIELFLFSSAVVETEGYLLLWDTQGWPQVVHQPYSDGPLPPHELELDGRTRGTLHVDEVEIETGEYNCFGDLGYAQRYSLTLTWDFGDGPPRYSEPGRPGLVFAPW